MDFSGFWGESESLLKTASVTASVPQKAEYELFGPPLKLVGQGRSWARGFRGTEAVTEVTLIFGGTLIIILIKS